MTSPGSGDGPTPGPWFQDEAGIFGQDDRWPDWQVASLCCPDMLCGLDPSEYPDDVKATIQANARLIAAAPDLLAVAREMLPRNLCLTNANVPDSAIVPLECTMGELRKVAAAIAKATGKATP